jgi:hypothetical protein
MAAFLCKDSAASVFLGFSVGSPSRQINANLIAIKAKHYQFCWFVLMHHTGMLGDFWEVPKTLPILYGCV